MIIYLIVD